MKEKLLNAVDQSINPKTLVINWGNVSQIMNLEKNTCKVQYQNVCIPEFKQLSIREVFYIGALCNYYDQDYKLIHEQYLSYMHYCNFIYALKQGRKMHQRIHEAYKKNDKTLLQKQEIIKLKQIWKFFEDTFINEDNVVNEPFSVYIKSFGDNMSLIELRFFFKIKEFVQNKKESIEKMGRYLDQFKDLNQ